MSRLIKAFAVVLGTAALIAPGAWAGNPSREDAFTQNDRVHSGGTQGGAYPSAVVVRVDEGFDWASAGVGAAGGVGLVLVAGSAVSVIRRRNSPIPA